MPVRKEEYLATQHDEKFRMMVERLVGFAGMHGRDKSKDPDAWGEHVRSSHREVIDYAEERMARAERAERVVRAVETLDAYVDFGESNLDEDGNWTSGPPDEPLPMDHAWLALGAAIAAYREGK